MSEQFTLDSGDTVEVGDEVIYAGQVGTLDYLHVANDVCRIKTGILKVDGSLGGVNTLSVTARSFLREARLANPAPQVIPEAPLATEPLSNEAKVVPFDTDLHMRMAKARGAKAAKAAERDNTQA